MFKARMQRANVLTKQGLFEEAIKDYNTVLKTDSSNAEASTRIDRLYSIVNDLGRVHSYIDGHDYMPAIELLTQILEVIIRYAINTKGAIMPLIHFP